MMLDIPFDNSYGSLPQRFFTRLKPTPVAKPGLIAINRDLAAELGLDADALASDDGIQALAGNRVPPGADPLAQVYAGHQFGGWSPQLGDGRALLLGEVIDTKGIRRDLQLKGSGPTPYSRMGDGRAWLGPVLREYIVSEAMHALGIPTTRALAAVTTGEPVQRERSLPGAVLTRVASSHIRVGTFQYFAARRDVDALRTLTDYVIARHYPDARSPLELLDAVIDRQARLIAQWMGVGFIHGVMNTDNSHIAGETIDYGPCAFMDNYHPDKVFSSIDQFGRYAYSRQPDIAAWNMAQLATSLLPLIDDNQDAAVEAATASVHALPRIFRESWLGIFRAKLGLTGAVAGDDELITSLLARMAATGADFTNTFRGLADGSARAQFSDPAAFDTWASGWHDRRKQETVSPASQHALMNQTNPAVVPRNHRIEEAINHGLSGDYDAFLRLAKVLETPFSLAPEHAEFAAPPAPEEVVRKTFCGT